MNAHPATFFRRWFSSRALLLVNAVLFVFIAFALGREFIRNHSIDREIAALQSEQQWLSEEIVSLEDYQEYLVTESFLEQEAREKFGLQRPGETQIYVEERAQEMPAPQTFSTQGVMANAQMWMWYFFNPDRYDVAQKD